ncbi:MAG: CDP-diacylglycerol--glycerol-3-phosphate 3-phosphatidyltransferase [Bifidobacteriaceae bacterium]|jgi:CDP-diacylglycerol--glycerol-3-phosphate 3-phosphatidyltransferase|nr:CDP-diacylglycerol--glycerol-3-phosphate 3-phosphatidyltransferase [Bifidobacteriaceae bacterium]
MVTINKNIPNIITFSRIILIPVFLYFIINGYSKTPFDFLYVSIGIAIFVILALTDKVDGVIARRYNLVSKTGKFVDPVADKCLMICGLGVLVAYNKLHISIAIILIVREFFITAFRLVWIGKKNIVIPADNLGKAKTVLFFVICSFAFLPNFDQEVNNILFLLVVLVSVVSCIRYVIEAIKKDKNAKR